jgi:hypothetical protein
MELFRLDFSRLFSVAGVSALLLLSAPAISAQPSAFIGWAEHEAAAVRFRLPTDQPKGYHAGRTTASAAEEQL